MKRRQWTVFLGGVAVCAFAKKWVENGKAEEGFLRYVDDRIKVTYPWTMIDKITPRPDPSVEKILLEDGVEGLEPVITSRNTYVAPFVMRKSVSIWW